MLNAGADEESASAAEPEGAFPGSVAFLNIEFYQTTKRLSGGS